MISKQSYQIQGMRQDNLVGTNTSDKFAHEIMNLRFNTTGDYTTATWTTEQGTLRKIIKPLDISTGTTEEFKWFGYGYDDSFDNFKPIGQCVINDQWILFGSINDTDYILRLIYKDNELYGKILFKGNLNFNINYPLETLPFYENEEIQKVYWIDGLNQPRVINITSDYKDNLNTQFDFVQEVNLRETVDITKIQSGTGLFPPCTVKYCITYYHLYGQESNIVYDSPLHYPTLGDRACSPEELSGDSFKITVKNIDNTHGFDYIRLYSIVRTTNDATPIVRIVEDKPINEDTTEVTFIDTNTTGEIVDPTILNYVGGREIIAETFDQKDNVLFLGNITLKDQSVTQLLKDTNINQISLEFESDETIKCIPSYVEPTNSLRSNDQITRELGKKYKYVSELNDYTFNIEDNTIRYKGNSHQVKVFKYNETYRFGIQFQNNKGIWSEVISLKDVVNDIKPTYKSYNNNEWYTVGYAKYVLPSQIVNLLIENGCKKARLVCCYPTNADRSIIAQGIICPTIKNEQWFKNNSPKYIASWFFRDNNTFYDREIQSSCEQSAKHLDYFKEDKGDYNDSKYTVDNTMWTLNSPEIELDDSIRTLDTRSFSIRGIGKLTLDTIFSSIYIDNGDMYTTPYGKRGKGLNTNTSINDNRLSTLYSFLWNDHDVFYQSSTGDGRRDYLLHPFQRASLNNYLKDIKWTYTDLDKDKVEETIKNTKLNNKIWSSLLYNSKTEYEPFNISIDDLQFFDSTEVTPLLFNDNVYYGNVNSISPIGDPLQVDNNHIIRNTFDDRYTAIGSYLIPYTRNGSLVYNQAGREIQYVIPTSDPVSITYKSTPHVVYSVNIGQTYNEFKIAEIYRTVNESQRFGGIDNINNVYLPCGPASPLKVSRDATLYGLEGDSYLQRYDCLKTYPYTTEDVNQVVEIASFMCETRVNLDGRYDKNRGLIDNTNVLPTNFNLINRSYTQSNNFFSYMRLDPLSAKLDNFANQFTWTKEKVSGEEVDTWTNITLANTADADGTLGQITKLLNQKGRLYLFQDHGIAQVGFNEKTAIATDTGVPIELANSGRYTGLSYLTTDVGCQNKWSISNTKNGMFFIDDSRQELLTIGENGPISLSTGNGFDAFLIQQLPKEFVKWNPNDFNNFVTYYDKLSNDVYYINKNVCLAWNEQTNSFTSFYNYEKVPYMTNIGNHSLMFKDGVWAAREKDCYSMFFDEYKQYYMTIVCDGITNDGSAFPADKVFNNVEYRMDSFNPDGINSNINTPMFDYKACWNGYQAYKEFPIDAIRKFNTWRLQLPRATYIQNGQLVTTRDRIRNSFCYIKLGWHPSTLPDYKHSRMILHDLAVYFDMK